MRASLRGRGERGEDALDARGNLGPRELADYPGPSLSPHMRREGLVGQQPVQRFRNRFG